MPFANVDDAEFEVTLSVLTARPPEKVEVEFAPVTLRYPTSVEVPVFVPCRVEVAVPLWDMERTVVEAPAVNCTSVEVETPTFATVNGHAKVS